MYKKNIEPEKRYIVSIGTFKTEASAVARQKAASASDLKADIIDTDDDPYCNMIAALLLIAEQLQDIKQIMASRPANGGEETQTKQAVLDQQAEAIRQARIARALSQAELGAICGVSASAISKIEQGHNGASPFLMNKIYDTLKIKR